ncbi:glycosyltransferase family 2 protein [Ectothiorhodospiraceae bacterium BW-2]|nr:glycosyltransferase family 2 protein [Ectothiorhodospiraceae bacterium BW-2]
MAQQQSLAAKVVAIVVLYYPKRQELEPLLQQLQQQCAQIVIANNTPEPFITEEWLPEPCVPVKCFNFGENIGIAKAQSIGMAWAFDNAAADFVLLMDQDSSIQTDMVQRLLHSYGWLTERSIKVGVIGPQPVDRDSGKELSLRLSRRKRIGNSALFLLREIISSGMLIPKATYQNSPAMRDEFFIDFVDFEYCWRLQDAGFSVVKDTSVLLEHKIGQGRTRMLGLFIFDLSEPIRHYYQFRNLIYLCFKDGRFNYTILFLIKLLIRQLFIIIGAAESGARWTFMKRGIKDAMKGSLGKYR